jgi:hypothetical protein
MATLSPSDREYRKTQNKKIITYGCLPVVAIAFLIAVVGSLADDKPGAKSDGADSTAQETEHKQTPAEFDAQLKREITSFSKGTMQAIAEDITVEQLQLRLILYSSWAVMLSKADSSALPETKKLAKELRENVVKRQKKDFPLLRKRYVEIVAAKLWENDIDVTASGKRNEYINFTAGAFAANKNIQEVQQTLSTVLQEFRFKQSRYRWYKGDDEYTYYTLESAADENVVPISWGK